MKTKILKLMWNNTHLNFHIVRSFSYLTPLHFSHPLEDDLLESERSDSNSSANSSESDIDPNPPAHALHVRVDEIYPDRIQDLRLYCARPEDQAEYFANKRANIESHYAESAREAQSNGISQEMIDQALANRDQTLSELAEQEEYLDLLRLRDNLSRERELMENLLHDRELSAEQRELSAEQRADLLRERAELSAERDREFARLGLNRNESRFPQDSSDVTETEFDSSDYNDD